MIFLQVATKGFIDDRGYMDCVESFKALMSDKDEYKLIELPQRNSYIENVVASDNARLDFAIENKNLIYSDVDVLWSALPKIKGNKPYISRQLNGDIDFWAFIVNGNTSFFEELKRVSIDNQFYGKMFSHKRTIRRMDNKFNIIDSSCCSHIQNSFTEGK
jgi:hypothetical protein